MLSDSCNSTTCTEDCIKLENNSFWEDSSSGRLKVCLNGAWREVVLGSIKTTKEMDSICEHLDFSEGSMNLITTYIQCLLLLPFKEQNQFMGKKPTAVCGLFFASGI